MRDSIDVLAEVTFREIAIEVKEAFIAWLTFKNVARATLWLVPLACAAFLCAGVIQIIAAKAEEIREWLVPQVAVHQIWMIPLTFALAVGESIAFVSLIVPATGLILAIVATLYAAKASTFALVSVGLFASAGAAVGYQLSFAGAAVYRESINDLAFVREHPVLTKFLRWCFQKPVLNVFIAGLGHTIGPLRGFVPALAGALGMPQWQFHIANLISSPVWGATVVYAAITGTHWLMG